LLGGAHFSQHVGPLADDYIAVHLEFLLPANRAGATERAHLTLFAYGTASLPTLFSARMPGHEIHFVRINLTALAFVILDRAPHADDATLISRVITDYDPIGAWLAKFAFQLITTLDGFFQGGILAAMYFIAQEFGFGYVV
jgi:hypothetical protein